MIRILLVNDTDVQNYKIPPYFTHCFMDITNFVAQTLQSNLLSITKKLVYNLFTIILLLQWHCSHLLPTQFVSFV